MQDNSSYIATLIHKWLSGEASEAEEAAINEWRKRDPRNEALIIAVTDDQVLKKSLADMSAYDEDIAWVNLQERINGSGTKQTKVRHLSRTGWWVAAACLLCLVFGAYWFLSTKEHTPGNATPLAVVQPDVRPGQSGAVLILDKGLRVNLDSLGNGALAMQGGVQLTKKDNQLAYTENANTDKLIYNTILTPKGRQYHLVLSDGTKVWLNSDAYLRFPVAFGASERKVEIGGEVYFEVAHVDMPGKNTRKPFIVHINSAKIKEGMDVEVLGTHFNINAYDDEETVRTTLLEGSINLKLGGNSTPAKPGQQLIVEEAERKVTVNEGVDLEEVIAWKNGRFEFDNVSLPVIMRQISRWYDVEVVYEGKPDNEKYSGAISKSVNLSDVLRMLESRRLKFKIDGNKLVVKP